MLFNVVVFLLVLSLLVFVHELGHFLAAKACNVYVDRFSIGMPPRVAGFRWGETDYCISALPIGGYVKMAGQEDAPMEEEERERDYGHVPPERWFHNKPVWQRVIVVIAGPLMNLVLAVGLYAGLAFAGAEVPEFEVSSRVGRIEENSPAAKAPLYRHREGAPLDRYTGEPDAAGWQTGDRVLAIDGRPVDNMSDLAISAILGGEGRTRHILLERETRDGELLRFVSPIAPALIEEAEHPRFGVATFETARIGEVLPGMPAENAGLQPGDIILRADGHRVDWGLFSERVSEKEEGVPLALEVLRGEEVIDLELLPETIGRIQGFMAGAPRGTREEDRDAARPVVHGVSPAFRETHGIQPKDVIAEINGQPATVRLLNDIQRERPNETVTLAIERPAILLGLIQRRETLVREIPIDGIRAIGVVHDPVTVYLRLPPLAALVDGFDKSWLALERTLLTIKALVVQDVSPKELGGPLMIMDVTTQAARAGWVWLIKITAFISINLCVFNLLPLPILDGGLLVMLLLESIRRKPISAKAQERFQQAGLLLIISLMLFVTWNDIWRVLDRITP